MAKYSTGGVGGDSGGACELCGAEGRDLQDATVAGARLQVCGECARHGEGGSRSGSGSNSGGRDGGQDREGTRNQQTAQNFARIDDARKGDPTRWEEEGTDYDDDPLPYLVRGYGDRLEEARQAAGLQTAELAAELGVDEADVLAVEQGRATRAGVGGSLISGLEERLNVQLAEEA
jgi:ribosome-binding protein aMBF1 (putative translation factor)